MLISTESRFSDVRTDARVVCATIGMTAECLAVAAHTEALAPPSNHDGTHRVIVIGLLQQVAIFRVQPARPRVHTLGPIEPNNRDALGVYFVFGVLQFHNYSA